MRSKSAPVIFRDNVPYALQSKISPIVECIDHESRVD